MKVVRVEVIFKPTSFQLALNEVSVAEVERSLNSTDIGGASSMRESILRRAVDLGKLRVESIRLLPDL